MEAKTEGTRSPGGVVRRWRTKYKRRRRRRRRPGVGRRGKERRREKGIRQWRKLEESKKMGIGM